MNQEPVKFVDAAKAANLDKTLDGSAMCAMKWIHFYIHLKEGLRLASPRLSSLACFAASPHARTCRPRLTSPPRHTRHAATTPQRHNATPPQRHNATTP